MVGGEKSQGQHKLANPDEPDVIRIVWLMNTHGEIALLSCTAHKVAVLLCMHTPRLKPRSVRANRIALTTWHQAHQALERSGLHVYSLLRLTTWSLRRCAGSDLLPLAQLVQDNSLAKRASCRSNLSVWSCPQHVQTFIGIHTDIAMARPHRCMHLVAQLRRHGLSPVPAIPLGCSNGV